ncbi:MAG: diguanylate cyclase [Rectinemataceae bacterium]
MDTRTLAFAVALVSVAVAALMVMQAAAGRKQLQVIFAGAFICGALGFVLLPFQEDLGPLFGIVVANMLSLAWLVGLVWGSRTFLEASPAWTWRLWILLGAWFILLAVLAFGLPTNNLRAIFASVFTVAATVELILAFWPRNPRVSEPFRKGSLVLAATLIACHALRIVLFLVSSSPEAKPFDNSFVNAFTSAFTIIQVIAFAGLVLMLDYASLKSELGRSEATLADMTMTDGLTGIGNRHFLEVSLPVELERSARYSRPLTLAIVALDHGRAVSGPIVKRLAALVKGHIRESDGLFRRGEAEFVVVATQTTQGAGLVLGEKLRQAIEAESFPGAGSMTVSIGIVEWQAQETPSQLFKRLEHTIYMAREAGGSCVVGFEHEWVLPPASMVRLEWKPEWASGDQRIDDSHRGLIEAAGTFLELAGTSTDKATFLARFDALLERLSAEFALEESILKAAGWMGLPEHARLHELISRDARAIRDAAARVESSPGALFNFIVGRLVGGHFLEADFHYGAWLRERAAGAEAGPVSSGSAPERAFRERKKTEVP